MSGTPAGRIAYALFMVLALGVFLLAKRLTPKGGGLAALTRRQQLAVGLAAFAGGVLGAKLPFVFVSGADWFGTAWLADGKTVTTGLIGAYLAVELMKLVLGVRAKTGDAFALPLALALAVGRWGCLCNGCCGGTPTALPWGIDLGDGVPRHPTQLYESLFHCAMAVVLVIIARRGWIATHRLQLYLMTYGVYRFLTEFIRPEPEYVAGLTYYQIVAVVLIAGPGLQWWWDERGKRNEAKVVEFAG